MAATMKSQTIRDATLAFTGAFLACLVFLLLLAGAYHLGQGRCKQERAEHPSTTHVNGGC